MLPLATLLAACSQPPGDAPVPAAAVANAAPAASPVPPAAAADPGAPHERFEGPARNFEAAKRALLDGYYRNSLSEEDLYRAAVQGMVEHADPALEKWNKLLSPSELAELRLDLQGELVGIGVKIELDPATGYIDVKGTVPGSPAERAGVAPPDKIVTVDGNVDPAS
jgi:C-terminal processing protease CtpA/Prc